MMKDENHYELTVGDKSRSGGQWDIWEATYSPVGADGYPTRLWDKQTGVDRHAVAETWKKYDLLDVLKTNWATLGPKVGAQDQRLRRRHGLVLSERRGREPQRVPVEDGQPEMDRARSSFQRRAPHCWGPRAPELLEKMTKQIDKYAPQGADTTSWRYR